MDDEAVFGLLDLCAQFAPFNGNGVQLDVLVGDTSTVDIIGNRIHNTLGSGVRTFTLNGDVTHNEFNGNGNRGLTVNGALTGAVELDFHYDEAGRIAIVRDAAGKESTVTYAAGGDSAFITGPYGHASELDFDASGQLTAVRTPGGAEWMLAYHPGVLPPPPPPAAPGRAAPKLQDLWPLFEMLGDVPALAIRGERSRTLTAECLEKMQRRHPKLRTVTVPGRGHCPNLTEPEARRGLEAFLDDVAGYA